ncbi:thiopeptide-type bacteriocin biosynthesis protein [Glycomyces sp. TRM65418]|uniref:thiopeptide-type bacteriocin biosynthesis protein n=1 Tax=Glycomyces sp. TRM65418 TaxID=2867006 RepID=UPI001CE5CE62|nr:thiopeptide-type bacteriocin biosynthesis protein [Glycomyces sp. TRM65418]MCC3765523.1 thiopeptide-type bacteriocin biosynthesis protein [Glycomyces sp. TRM65418]QZD55130.1 thiopeptide-type bacteriocin biosynthesis protein [Glycomyces sp. TRM65418]
MTESTSDRNWRALHVFCHRGKAAADRLVTATIAPLARSLRAEGLIDRWFFIRYWEGGPHVRVRLAGPDKERLDRAQAMMRAALETPLSTEPAPRLDPVEFYQQFAIPADEARALEWNPDGRVVEAEYLPETDRYGGPDAIGPAEDLFHISSELAAAVIARTPGEQARTGVALDLLLGFVSAMYTTASESVRWLREYATMWRYLDAAVARTFAQTHAAAESTMVATGLELMRRRDAQKEAAPAAYRQWWDAVGRMTDRLRELGRTGRLTGSADSVMVSHLHMIYNRMGMTASDEVYLAWLASLLIAAPGKYPDYFADGPAAPDRAYHELSKFRPVTMGDQQPRQGEPIVRVLEFASDEAVPLPPVDPALAAAPLAEVIAARRSARDGFTGRLGLDRLGNLLGLGAGVVDTEWYEEADPPTPRQVMANPSAGMAYPLIVRVLARAVEGIDPALYEYLPRTHELQMVGTATDVDVLRYSSPFFLGDEPRIEVAEVPAVLFIGADLGRMRPRYGLRAHRFATLEIGHAAQSLLLVSTALGLRSVSVGGFFDDAVCEIAQLDGYDEIIGYMIPIGAPSDDANATTSDGGSHS